MCIKCSCKVTISYGINQERTNCDPKADASCPDAGRHTDNWPALQKKIPKKVYKIVQNCKLHHNQEHTRNKTQTSLLPPSSDPHSAHRGDIFSRWDAVERRVGFSRIIWFGDLPDLSPDPICLCYMKKTEKNSESNFHDRPSWVPRHPRNSNKSLEHKTELHWVMEFRSVLVGEPNQRSAPDWDPHQLSLDDSVYLVRTRRNDVHVWEQPNLWSFPAVRLHPLSSHCTFWKGN